MSLLQPPSQAARQGQVITHFCVLTLSTTAAVEKCHEKQQQKKITKCSLPEEPLRREEAPSKKGKEPKNRFCAKVISVLQKFFEKPKEGPQFCASVWVELLLCCAGRGEDAVLRTFWTTFGHIW